MPYRSTREHLRAAGLVLLALLVGYTVGTLRFRFDLWYHHQVIGVR